MLILLYSALAGETFNTSVDVGGTARFVDHVALSDPSMFGLTVGARLALDVKLQARLDVRYVEGQIFDPTDDRYFDLSTGISSPALLIFCADVHELFWRVSSRPGDDLFYLHTGLGMKGRTGPVTLKGTLGFSYLASSGEEAEVQASALGGFVGGDMILSTRWIDVNARAAVFVAFDDANPYLGWATDGDLTVKIPAGPIYVGPRLDVSYRNHGLNRDLGNLFGQRQELAGHLGIAIGWGSKGG